MMLIQLIYTSKCHHLMTEETLTTIMESAVRHNKNNGITGLLLFYKDTFIQLIEGEEEKVDETYLRISQDTRHDIQEIHFRTPITQREFGQWHMGFHRVNEHDLAQLPAFAPFFEAGFDSSQLTIQPQDGLVILKAFAELTQ